MTAILSQILVKVKPTHPPPNSSYRLMRVKAGFFCQIRFEQNLFKVPTLASLVSCDWILKGRSIEALK